MTILSWRDFGRTRTPPDYPRSSSNYSQKEIMELGQKLGLLDYVIKSD